MAPQAAAVKGKKKALTFTVDCQKPVEDKIMDIASFEKFLVDKIKVDNKTGAVLAQSVLLCVNVCTQAPCCASGVLGDNIKVTREKSKVSVTSEIHMSKRSVASLACDFHAY
jgi:large subunit ribosomal protein L22e